MAFTIPNQEQYMTHSVPAAPSADVDLAQQPLDPNEQIMRMVLDMLQKPAPIAPTPKLGMGQRFAMGANPHLRDLIMQQAMSQAPGYQEYAQDQARMEQLKAVAPLLNSMGTSQRQQDRFEFYRWLPGQLNYLDPVKGNVSLPVWKDRMTGQFTDTNRQPLNLPSGGLNMPMHFTPYAGPGGEPAFAPTSPSPGETPQVPQAGVPTGASAAAPGITPTSRPTEGGAQQQGGGPSNVLNIPRLGRRGQQPSGNLPPHMAPAGAAENVAHRTAFAIGLDSLIGLQKEAYKSQTSKFGTTGGIDLSDPVDSLGNIASLASQNVADYTSRNPRLQPLLQDPSMRSVLNYNVNMQPALFSYTKSQTGAQFGMQEFDRYRSSFPTSMDDEYTATEKIGSLLRIVRADVIASQQQFHGIEVDPRFTVYIGRIMPRINFNRLSAEDRIAFIAGGGTVRE